ncbi:MAG: hypothetical protein M1358_07395 [Chloroflexi bacterium]|nr:hypothetical protein [Chloroflexota bacterium]
MKLLAILGVLILAMLPLTVDAAGPRPATDVFYGTATTGVGQPMPVDINPADVTLRSDGAIGLGYVYRANGKANGAVPGNFSYEEHGYLYFYNPADPTTFAGSTFVSGIFTLDPHRRGLGNVVIADTNPAAYTHGISVLEPKSAKGLLSNIPKVLAKHGVLSPGE